MGSCLTHNTINALVEGRLAPEEETSANEHLAACGICQGLLDAVRPSFPNASDTEIRGQARAAPGPSLPDLIGRHVGKVRITGYIGEGGMGRVYKAEDELRNLFAVKVMHPEWARDPDNVARFRNEARVSEVIDHLGLVCIYGLYYLDDGLPCIVMKYVKGETLEKRLRSRGPFAPNAMIQLGWQMATALSAVHDKDIVHRDLKPANVMLVADPYVPGGERTLILDFGIAKLGSALREGEAGDEGPRQTRSGVGMGTPIYVAPEQASDAAYADGRADVYSLGMVFYEMLTLASVNDLRKLRGSDELPSLPQAPRRLAGLLGRMLAFRPEGRPTMQAVADELREILDADTQEVPTSVRIAVGKSKAPRPRWRIATRALIIAAGLGGIGSGVVINNIGLEGQCASDGCWRVNTVREPVLGLTLGGAALTLAGVLLIAMPDKRLRKSGNEGAP